MRDDVSYILGPGGPFAALPDYEQRAEQVRYAHAVEKTLNQPEPAEGEPSVPLLIEGPTGTGKTLGYLLPAIANVLRNPFRDGESVDRGIEDEERKQDYKRRVTIVTGNIALQEQLVTKDLPFIKKVTGWNFNWALIKGRSNYGCARSVEDLDKQKQEKLFEDNLDAEVRRLREWFKRTKTGDKSEIDPSPIPTAWSLVTSTADDCTGRKCPFFQDCHYYNQRRKARESEVVVTNYAFLMTEVALRIEFGAPSVLIPEFDILICDEAHDLGEVARRYFAQEIRSTQLNALGRLLNNPIMRLDGLAKEVWALSRSLKDWGSIHRSTDEGALFDPLHYQEKRDLATALMLKVVKAVESRVADYKRENGIDESIADAAEGHKVAIDRLLRPCALAKKYGAAFLAVFPLTADPGTVYFVESSFSDDEKSSVAFVACPFSAGAALKDFLWHDCGRAILTSATLATKLKSDGGTSRFQFVRDDLGLGDWKCYEEIVGSPFDLAHNMALYIDAESDPSNRDPREVGDRILDLILASDGRSLVLFTSYAAMNSCYEQVRNELEGRGIRCFKQGDRSRLILTRAFREDIRSCLFATRSFFQGIDIQGESLSQVILDKMPFPGMHDPFMAHVQSKDRNWFMNHSLPRAMMSFRQAIGRLIRTKTDRGVVSILDCRIARGGKGYGAMFRNAVPTQQMLGGPDDVRAFLGFASAPVPVEPKEPQEPADDYPSLDDDIPF